MVDFGDYLKLEACSHKVLPYMSVSKVQKIAGKAKIHKFK